MKTALAPMLVLALAACSSTAPSSDPGVAVVWHRVDEPHRVCESLSGRKHFFNVLGCVHRSEPAEEGAPRVCAIYAPAPRSERDLQRFATLGHELMHCFDGEWHDRWGRMKEGAAASRALREAPASQAAIEQ